MKRSRDEGERLAGAKAAASAEGRTCSLSDSAAAAGFWFRRGSGPEGWEDRFAPGTEALEVPSRKESTQVKIKHSIRGMERS